MQQKASFDPYAQIYHELLSRTVRVTGGTSADYARYKTSIVAACLADRAVSCLLDVGCGDGLTEVFFRDLFTTADLIGLDVSSECIATAKKRGVARCRFDSYDGFEMPVSDRCADVVYLSCVLHHVPPERHQSLLHECARVLKPEGHLFIFEHNPLNPVTRHIVRGCVFDKDATLVHAREALAAVLKAGFRMARVRYTLFFPRHAIFMPFHRLERFMAKIPFGGQYYLAARNPCRGPSQRTPLARQSG